MGAALHHAGVHQQMSALYALAGLLVRARAQPAVVRALRLGVQGRLAQFWRQGGTNVVDQDAAARHQVGGAHQRERVFFGAQVAHHQGAQVALGFRQGGPCGGGLHNHPRLGLVGRWQGLQAQRLQHHQRVGQGQRMLRLRVMGDVAVEVGAGEHHTQALRAMALVPGFYRGGRALGVQGQHELVLRSLCIWPLQHNARIMERQQLLPALGGLPVAIVGVGPRWADNHHTVFLHGAVYT